MTYDAFPLFLDLEGRSVLVVGDGEAAFARAELLRDHGALVRVVGVRATAAIVAASREFVQRSFRDEDVEGAWVVFALGTSLENARVKRAADARNVFCVAIDDPRNGSAMSASILRRGGITVALSSSGSAPGLVALLRAAIDSLLPIELEEWVRVAREARAEWKTERTPFATRRSVLLQRLNALYATPALAKGNHCVTSPNHARERSTQLR